MTECSTGPSAVANNDSATCVTTGYTSAQSDGSDGVRVVEVNNRPGNMEKKCGNKLTQPAGLVQ